MRKSDMLLTADGKFFSYEMIGEFRSNGRWIHPARTINSYELILVLKGTLYITEDGEEFEIGEDRLIILEPGKFHAGTRETDQAVSFYWFHFNTDLPVTVKTAEPGDVYDIKFYLKKLLHTAHSGDCSPDAADALGLLIYSECMKLGRTAFKNIALATEIKEYIRTGVLSQMTVAEVAEHFGYSSDYIGRLFKDNFGISLKKYIDIQRVNLAKDMLLTSLKSVKEIACDLGYKDENLFIKFFIYHEKISPTVFRNKHFGTHINNK